MLRIPVRNRIYSAQLIRTKTTSNSIRSTFIEYFVQNHGHKYVKSSSVMPLCDPTVPFVNAGMNQFKSVFLGKVDAPYPRVVNSQKCVRVGGKHNDLDVVGTDGHHHTFFEMLGNWSFGEYYKKDACQMAWDLLLGPYRLKPEDLVVTYFSGDAVIGLQEDRECRDVWKNIGVQSSRIIGKGAADNFWEMSATGPCGPCTEIHHVNPDGSLTEIWNLVFIQFNRESSNRVSGLRQRHVDTGMGLERMAALMQRVPSNYDTDLFQPIIRTIHTNSKGGAAYGGRYGSGAPLDAAYRRLADHARMISVCLADGVFPAANLNLKQIMRKSFKMATEVFQNPSLLPVLYDEVAARLGDTYPELVSKEKEAKLIIHQEADAYARMRAELLKKWKGLVKAYPEVESLADVETSGFVLGYKEFKESMSKVNSTVIPGDLVFKLYDTHGFQEDVIDRVAKLNKLEIDKKEFWKLLSQHKSRHKTAFKEQTSDKGFKFNEAIEKLIQIGITSTNDQPKYDCKVIGNKIEIPLLKTNIVAILNEDYEWIDFLDPCESRPYCVVTKDTNFYCEEGGQEADTGVIRLNEDVSLNVDSVFKIRDFVFHKGYFRVKEFSDNKYVNCESEVTLLVDSDKRVSVMANHTGVHLLNAAVRTVLPNSVVCQVGSKVTHKGLSLSLSVYGDKLTQEVVLEAENLVRESIKCNVALETKVIDSMQVSQDASILTVPGETYPDTGLRMVATTPPLPSKELCCGTHVPSTGFLEEFCVTVVKGAGGHTPCLHALTGANARQARELFCRAQKLSEVIELVDPERKAEEISGIRRQLTELCGGGGAPYGAHAQCLTLLANLQKRKTADVALDAIAREEVARACAEAAEQGRAFTVHFVRCSYLMCGERLGGVLRAVRPPSPALLVGCAGGVLLASAALPQEMVTASFNAESWLRCVTPVFQADVATATPTYAAMTPTKVSLINCEQLVQDAMRAAVKYAQAHASPAHAHTKDAKLN